jgi:hypothetical protein
MLFISGISLLILDNLKDNDKFINTTKTTPNLVQINVSIKNINHEIKQTINNIDENSLDIVLDNVPSIIPYGDILISNIELYSLDLTNKYDINKNYTKTDIDYPYDLYEISKKNIVYNNRQKDNLIEQYIKITKDDKILNIKDDFLVNYEEYNKTKRYIIFNYDLKVENITTHIDYTFEYKGIDKYFDFYFKSLN